MAVKGDARKAKVPPRPVIGRSIATGEEFYFSSLYEAKQEGFHPHTISLCLKGKLSQTGGLTWERWE